VQYKRADTEKSSCQKEIDYTVPGLSKTQATNGEAVLYIQRVPFLAEADWGEWRMFL
jgi:hypothetical protein